MAWGNKNRKGAKRGSKSGQFKNGKKGGETIDGRCTECGGVEGRHNRVRMSKRVPNPESRGNYKNTIVWEKCPNA